VQRICNIKTRLLQMQNALNLINKLRKYKDLRKIRKNAFKKRLLMLFVKCFLLNIYLNNLYTIILHTLDTRIL